MTELEARAIAAPDSWPWPMSEDAKQWVASAKMQASKHETPAQQSSTGSAGGGFDRQAHDEFMRGL